MRIVSEEWPIAGQKAVELPSLQGAHTSLLEEIEEKRHPQELRRRGECGKRRKAAELPQKRCLIFRVEVEARQPSGKYVYSHHFRGLIFS